MSLRKSIQFAVPALDIRLWTDGKQEDFSEQLRTAEQLQAAERVGYKRGFIDGEKALSEQLLRQRAELLELHNGAIAALQQAVPQVVQQTEDALIALALEIAQKLVSDLPITREVVAATVREALEQVEDTAEFNVLLHAADLELLGADATRIFGIETSGRKMRFTASRDVSRGGCLVQTRFGSIDTRRETKLARVAETLDIS